MIEAHNLTKAYPHKKAVDDISFTVQPGRVTGFLGPNGAGKSTTMRMILGLDGPTTGTVTVNGAAYSKHPAPLREVGALLDAKAVHPARSAYSHLLALGATHGIPARRVRDVIEMTGLAAAAGRKVGEFSLGMGQRIGIAGALLGDPATVILDEPVNGLDPEGVIWVRNLVRGLAAEGRTVFLSSHLMSEMAQTADHLLVIGRGRILADGPMQQILAGTASTVHVRTDSTRKLGGLLASRGAVVQISGDQLSVSGLDGRQIARVALEHSLLIYELVPQQASLEEAYLELTKDDVEYRSLALAEKGN